MTDQELLQQAKDQVIKKYEKEHRTNWTDLDKESALLAIQSAREEGIEIIEEALACAPQDVDSVLKNGLKKLTAPGR